MIRALAFNIHESMEKKMYVGVGVWVCVESGSSSDPNKPGSKLFSILNNAMKDFLKNIYLERIILNRKTWAEYECFLLFLLIFNLFSNFICLI